MENNLTIKIIKGTKQIGGCITEISSSQASIIIDFGCDLDNSNKTNIIGLTENKSKYDALIITHAHQDHIGLIDNVLEDIPIYVEKENKKMYRILNDFTNNNSKRDTIDFVFEKPFWIKDMKITAFIVDHSLYNSAMILVECDGKKILHTGDFRNHGYKGKLLFPTLNKIGKVDALIIEGTTISRNNNNFITEQELTKKATKICKKYDQVFILQSSTNLDRLVSFYKACKRSNKNLVLDLFTSVITSELNTTIPNPISFNDVSVWIPLKYRNKSDAFKNKYIMPYNTYSNSKAVTNEYAMLVKTSMFDDIKLLYSKGLIKNACLIYSMWSGYKNNKSFKDFLTKVEELNINIENLHTSGHADINTLKEVVSITNADKVVVIHTIENDRSINIFENIVRINDGEMVEV
ncbi:ribonuclease J [Bacilli bacterium PM5-3]|nr:ribonuclease J [Bacilli bacterium PM5-3]